MLRRCVGADRGRARERRDGDEKTLHDASRRWWEEGARAISGTPRAAVKGRIMPSFDIVSRLELAEVDNALAGMLREIATRFDFKNSKSTISRAESALTILADDDLKLKQM